MMGHLILKLIYLEVWRRMRIGIYDHTLIDDSSAQGGDKENYIVEDNSNMSKDVTIDT